MTGNLQVAPHQRSTYPPLRQKWGWPDLRSRGNLLYALRRYTRNRRKLVAIFPASYRQSRTVNRACNHNSPTGVSIMQMLSEK